MQKLSKNILRLDLSAHARVGDRKAATRQMRCLLSFGVKRDRFRVVALLAVRSGQDRIQIKIIWIELERPLTLANCIVDLVIGKVCGRGNVAGDGRHRI